MNRIICFFIGHKLDDQGHDGYDFCTRCGDDEYYDSNNFTNSWNNNIPTYYHNFKTKIKWWFEKYIINKYFHKDDLPF